MAYCFAKRDTSVEEGFRRIAIEIFDKAMRQAEKAQAGAPAAGDATIHQLRKNCKKLRGLYRLVRPGFADYATENAAIRDAADGLSSARDAEVLVETFDLLVKPTEIVPEPVAAFRVRLHARCEELARGRSAAAAFADFRNALAVARKRAKRWRLEEDGFDALADGLETSFAGARKTMRLARKQPSPDLFHEWRKRAKNHWYHARLLAPIWPGLLNTHVKITEELGELLGNHHDVCVFRDAVAHEASGQHETIDFLRSLADRREAEIATECFALGGRLLAEEPAALTKRWRAYWKCWRREQPALPEPVS